MPELTSTHIAILEALVARGFSPVAFPLYAAAIGIRRGSYAALLAPDVGGGLRILVEPCYLIDGNLGVRVRREGRDCFVWKGKEVEAAPRLLAELGQFASDLAGLLAPAA